MNQTLATLGLSGLLMLTTQARPQDSRTLVDLAVGAGEFTTLVAAVEAAGLVGALSGDGPLTVFAPTDEAFAALGEDTLKELLTERGRPQLKRILLHHVVAGEVLAEDVVQPNGLATLAETRLTAQAALGRVIVDGAAVETADLRASNGVIHVIDRVLLPPARSAALEALLVGAVERGVALFNNGDEAGCCAVYATALDALRLGGGFGLLDWEREVLLGMVSEANRSARGTGVGLGLPGHHRRGCSPANCRAPRLRSTKQAAWSSASVAWPRLDDGTPSSTASWGAGPRAGSVRPRAR